MPKKKETSPEVLIPRSLEQIHSDLGEARHRLDEAFVAFDRGTLADRVWIGVCCLAAQEHHCIQDHSDRGRRKGKKLVTRDELALSDPHPQGFSGWLKVASPWLQRPTAYKYMDAAKGCGLTAWATEQGARDAVAKLLQAYDDQGENLSIKALSDLGKTPAVKGSPEPVKMVQLTFDDFIGFRAAATDILSKRDRMTAPVQEALTEETRKLLESLTDQRWEPTGEKLTEIITEA